MRRSIMIEGEVKFNKNNKHSRSFEKRKQTACMQNNEISTKSYGFQTNAPENSVM